MNYFDIIKNAVAQGTATLSESAHSRRFVYPISKETATEMLTQAYRVEVEGRGYSYAPNEATATRLSQVGRWLTDSRCKPSLLLYGSQPGTGKTTTARAIKRLAETLYESMKESIAVAEEKLREEGAAQVAGKIVIPYPEGVSPEEFSGLAGYKKRKEWEMAHPEEAKILSDKEAERQAAIEEWARPRKREIEEARYRVDCFARMIPKYITAQGLADLLKVEDFQGYGSCVNAAFLIIDDIGTEPIAVKNYGNEVLPFTELLLKRYEARRPTIITTNLSESVIENTYGTRIMDRLNEICDKIPYGGESYRR